MGSPRPAPDHPFNNRIHTHLQPDHPFIDVHIENQIRHLYKLATTICSSPLSKSRPYPLCLLDVYNGKKIYISIGAGVRFVRSQFMQFREDNIDLSFDLQQNREMSEIVRRKFRRDELDPIWG